MPNVKEFPFPIGDKLHELIRPIPEKLPVLWGFMGIFRAHPFRKIK